MLKYLPLALCLACSLARAAEPVKITIDHRKPLDREVALEGRSVSLDAHQVLEVDAAAR